MKKPDNVVYNYTNKEYDAFKKNYPTSFNSKGFNLEVIKNLKSESKPYFESKFHEIKEDYEKLLEKLKWNELIFQSKYNFNPIIGKEYYLYKGKETNFLSIIKPNEWNIPYIGAFKISSNNTWERIE